MANFCCSSISHAILNNDIQKLQELIKKRKRVDVCDNLGYNALHLAVRSKNAAIVDILLKQSSIDINVRTYEGFTSLYVACDAKNPRIDIIEKLLKHNANPNIGNTEQITPLHISCKYDKIDVVKILISYNADVNSVDYNKETPLHYAIEKNQQQIVSCLLTNGADPNIVQCNKMNALMLSLLHVRKFANIFLPLTKNLDQRSQYDHSAIVLAIIKGNFEMVQNLIAFGAAINITGRYSPLSVAVENSDIRFFELIWKNVDHAIALNDLSTAKTCVGEWIMFDNFKPLQIILCTPHVEFTALNSNIQELFSLYYPGDKLHFWDNKREYLFFFGYLATHCIILSTSEILMFLKYLHDCEYIFDIFEILLEKIKLDITEHLVLYSSEINIKLSLLLLQNCVHFNPDGLFQFMINKIHSLDIEDIMSNFLKFFTLNIYYKTKILYLVNGNTTLGKKILEILNRNEPVKSLRELSRDVVRDTMQEMCDESKEFLDIVEGLEVPLIVKDILRCKVAVNK